MTCQSVSATHWYDAQSCLGVYQSTSHLIYCAVSAYGHTHIHALASCLASQFLSMASPLSPSHIKLCPMPGHRSWYGTYYSLLVMGA